MNIVCDKTLLSAAIDGVSKAVTMRSSIPVLEGILLKAEGFQLTLTGYDLEMGIVTTIEANIKEPGEIVLNAKLLSSMISRMPAGQISIVITARPPSRAVWHSLRSSLCRLPISRICPTPARSRP